MKNKAIILGDAVNSTHTIELYKKNKKTSILEKLNKKSMLKANEIDSCYNAPIDLSWVPFATGHYNISPDLNDYIVVRIPALTSEIPNRNMAAFPTSVLFAFDPEYSRLRYQTFIGRPICREHNNKNLKESQGIIVDASIVPVPSYKVVKVMLLALIDRTKCSEINTILRGKASYSMGCLNGSFTCSYCFKTLGPEVQRTCTCYHTDYTNMSSYGGIYNGRLHFLYANNPIYGECSLVNAPADISAVGDMIGSLLK